MTFVPMYLNINVTFKCRLYPLAIDAQWTELI
jgi:hypothetical protein